MFVTRKSVSWKTIAAFSFCVLLCLAEVWVVKAGWIETRLRDLTSLSLAAISLWVSAMVLLRSDRTTKTRVVIVGSGARASAAWRELRTRQHDTSELLGFIDERNQDQMAPDVAHRLLGSVNDFPEYLLRNVVDEIVIAAPIRSCFDMIEKCVAIAEVCGVAVSYMRDVLPSTGNQRGRDNGRMFTPLTHDQRGHSVSNFAKRALDVVIASGMLILLWPFMLVIAGIIKVTSAGPVFFVQKRTGHRRRIFPMIKFRTMVQDADGMLKSLESQNQAAGPLFKLNSDPRTTSFGRFLRKTSLDELPQLLNVLAGQMSLVGPRPMSLRDLSHVSDSMMLRRFSVKPGMTGMWQVRGRSTTSLMQWAALDAQYVDQWSIKLDIEILALTLPAVLRRSGAV
jgi:exopolysaccharide biosynthesis polyprenyl glycosylphosphotransferase